MHARRAARSVGGRTNWLGDQHGTTERRRGERSLELGATRTTGGQSPRRRRRVVLARPRTRCCRGTPRPGWSSDARPATAHRSRAPATPQPRFRSHPAEPRPVGRRHGLHGPRHRSRLGGRPAALVVGRGAREPVLPAHRPRHDVHADRRDPRGRAVRRPAAEHPEAARTGTVASARSHARSHRTGPRRVPGARVPLDAARSGHGPHRTRPRRPDRPRRHHDGLGCRCRPRRAHHHRTRPAAHPALQHRHRVALGLR